MIELTEQQRHELHVSGEQPVRLTDPDTQTEYVLVRAEVYARLRGVLYDGDEADLDQALPLVNELMAEDDAGDPLLEGYQHYRKGRS